MLDKISEKLGKATAWLTVLMVIATVVVVILRRVFDVGLIWLQESVVLMHAIVFMVGAAYTLQQDEHVRVDIFYRRMGERGRALVDAAGVLLFLLPLCIFFFSRSFDFVAASWGLREASRESGGLAYPLLPVLKTVLLIMPLTVGLQGIAILLRAIRTLRTI